MAAGTTGGQAEIIWVIADFFNSAQNTVNQSDLRHPCAIKNPANGTRMTQMKQTGTDFFEVVSGFAKIRGNHATGYFKHREHKGQHGEPQRLDYQKLHLRDLCAFLFFSVLKKKMSSSVT